VLPPWHNMVGTKRVMLEYRHLETQIQTAACGAGASARSASTAAASTSVPAVYDLTLARGDDASRWRFKMKVGRCRLNPG